MRRTVGNAITRADYCNSKTFQLALLCSVSVFACGVVLERAPSAQAQTISANRTLTVTSTGADIYINPGVSVDVNVGLGGAPAIEDATSIMNSIANQGTLASANNDGIIIQNGYANSVAVNSTVNALTNNNLIYGELKGIFNEFGSIGTLINAQSATISALRIGIYNDSGNIGTLTNNGLITAPGTTQPQVADAGSGTGAIIDSGNIQVLTNNGTLSGLVGFIQAHGTVGTLTNANAINGVQTGIVISSGGIQMLTNSGSINGSIYAIDNIGTIGVLTNSNSISASIYGLKNAGAINILNNFGRINANGTTSMSSGATTSSNAAGMALSNSGTIATLYNDVGGVISSNMTGLLNTGEVGALTNAGTISAAGTSTVFYLNSGSGNNSFNSGLALSNSGSIATLVNLEGAVIAGYSSGLTNSGAIGTLTNNGSISGDRFGLLNFGNIGLLDNQTDGVIDALAYGLDNVGTIGTLINAGIITNGAVISSSGVIGTLTNSGTISGSLYGVNSQGSIGILDNEIEGVISSYSQSGIYNRGAIGTIINAGTIKNSIFSGIDNASEISVLDNQVSGFIGGGETGIYNAGGIGSLANSGTIAGDEHGVINRAALGARSAAIIGTLTNSGLISSQTNFAITNTGNSTVGILSNTGTISGPGGIYNVGIISTLTNFGTISGSAIGIVNSGTIGAINNGARGTITGGVSVINSSYGGLGTLTNSGLISGNIFVWDQNLNIIGGSGANFGTLSGGVMTLTPGDNLNLLSGNEILTDNVVLQNVLPPPLVLPLTLPQLLVSAGTLTNSGVLQIGSTGAPGTITVSGNFTQTSAGTLNVIVTPTASSQMTVTGTASLSGALDYIFAPGTYTRHTYTFLNAGTIAGNFATINYDNIPLDAASTNIEGDPTDNLVINSGFNFVPGQAQLVSPTDAAIFSAQTQALAQATQQSTSSLLGIAGTGGAAASLTCGTQAPVTPASTSGNGVADAGRIAQAIGSKFCGAGGWIQAAGSLGHVSGSGGASAYNANTAGFLAGIDKPIGSAGARIGFAVGYDNTDLNDKSGGNGNMGTARVAVYASQPLGAFTLAGVLGYGYAGNSTSRADGIGNIKENNNLSIIDGGLQASTEVTFRGITMSPAAGIRFAGVQATNFAEPGNGLTGAFALHGRSQRYTSVQPYVQAGARESFLGAMGYLVSPSVSLGLQDEAANLGNATDVFAADGTPFQTSHNELDPIAALLGAGLSASKNNVTLFIDYNGQISGNWNTQTGEAGLRVAF